MKVLLLTVVMITGLLLSASSVYLGKMVFADDQWSNIVARQLEQTARASMIYNDKYQFSNLANAGSSYSGLSSLSTDETSKGRDLSGLAQMSLENALSTFDKIHAKQLVSTQNTGYAGLTSVTTDTQGRDRNALVAQARASSDAQVADLVSQLASIQASYTNMSQVTGTDESTIDRQALLEKSWDLQEAQAARLLNQIWQIDQSYVNLKSGPTTNENTQGRQIDAAQASALAKAVQIFEEIHAQKLAASYATGYPGLGSTSTNEDMLGKGSHTYGDRHTEIDIGTQMSLQNAINFYNAYYPSTPLNPPLYSH